MWITRTSINQPVFATMVMAALCVLGIFSYNALRVERMPDITVPFVFIQVNYPGASPEAVENDVVVRRYRVIVGKTEKPSPTLTAEITSVNLNPTWTVPSSIAKTEISAHMRKDPSYLSRMHMDVLDAHDNPIDPNSVDWSGARTPNFTVRQQNGVETVQSDSERLLAKVRRGVNQHILAAAGDQDRRAQPLIVGIARLAHAARTSERGNSHGGA